MNTMRHVVKPDIASLDDVVDYLCEWDDVTVVIERPDPVREAMRDLNDRGRRSWALAMEVL